MKTFNTNFTVYFEDLSPSGKIHLEKLTEWMSMAREEYFKITCPDHLKFVDSPVKMFTANVSIAVKGRSQWTDTIEAVLTTDNIKKISFEMCIDFVNKRSSEVVATAIQKVAFVDTKKQGFSPVPEDMKQVIVNYVRGKQH